MKDALPPPIAAYFAANAVFDLIGMIEPFAGDAVVFDEGVKHEGRDAIKDWIQSATIGNKAIFTPEQQKDVADQVVVDGKVAGEFPGSPISLTFRFTLQNARIIKLEIQ